MSANPYGVRTAQIIDMDRLVPMVCAIYREEKPFPVSEARISDMVLHVLEDGIAGIIDGPKGIEATVGMTVEAEDYTEQQHVLVRWMSVDPPLRRRVPHLMHLMQFVQWYHERAEALTGSPMPVMFSTFGGDNTRGKVSFLHRQAPLIGVVHGYGSLFGSVALQLPREAHRSAAPMRGDQ